MLFIKFPYLNFFIFHFLLISITSVNSNNWKWVGDNCLLLYYLWRGALATCVVAPAMHTSHWLRIHHISININWCTVSLQDNEAILEAYTNLWVSDALDRAAIRGSVAYTLVVHHLSSFIFHACPMDKLLLRNRLARSLLRDYAGKQQHEVTKVLKAFILMDKW